MKKIYYILFILWSCFSNTWADSIFVVSNIPYKKINEKTVIVCAIYKNNKYIQTFEDSILNIPPSIVHERQKYKVQGIGKGAFFANNKIRHINIGNGIEEIQKHAFESCANLESIFIPSSIRTIDDYVFPFCLNLSSIKVDKENPFFDSRNDCNAIISKKDNRLLYGCKNTEIPSSVYLIESFAFYGCPIESIHITKGVKEIMKYAFCNCPFLKHIKISSTVEWIEGSSFSDCGNISYISVDDNNKSYDSRNNCNAIIHKDTDKLVLGCSNTTIPSNISEIGESAFSGLTNLHSINIPEGITTIHDAAFYKCTALKHINLPSTLKYFEGQTHFADCVSLDSIFIPRNVEILPNNIFNGCISLQSVNVDKKNTTYDSRNNCNAIICSDNDELVAGCKSSIIVDGVKSIGENAFCRSGITSINIPASVEKINSMAFSGSKYCKTITVNPNNNYYESGGTNSIINKKKDILILACSTSTIDPEITNICSFVNTNDVLILPSGIERIENYAFIDCKDLRTIFIPATIKYIGRFAFTGCENLHRAIIMGNNVNIDKEAFKGCNQLILP